MGKSYETAAARWAGVGPYYAMFPTEFTEAVIDKYTRPGDRVLDPFAGRASSIFSAATRGRSGVGIEINPVGWVYGQTKLSPAPREKVEARLVTVAREADADGSDAGAYLPEFFHRCYSERVLRFLLKAREALDWKKDPVDRTLMAITLVDLHGGVTRALSNQMRQGKAMAPDYSVRWWDEHGSEPPDVDPVPFLTRKLAWRYAKGVPAVQPSDVLLGDSRALLPAVKEGVARGKERPFKLLFTSPPYCGVTNYYYDQWLRLWMLGGPAWPTKWGEAGRGDFRARETYRSLLSEVFTQAAEIMDNKEGRVYVRTDAREFTCNATLEVLKEAFPGWKVATIQRPFARQTQTALYGDKEEKPGEIDIVMSCA